MSLATPFCMMSGQVIGQNKSVESHSHTCKTVLALKNNLLYDLALAPNIEVELPLGKRWSLNVEYKCLGGLTADVILLSVLRSGRRESVDVP